MHSDSMGTRVRPQDAAAQGDGFAQNGDAAPAAEHKGQVFSGLCVTECEELGTRRYRSAKGIMPPSAELFMPLLHGMGPMTSHAGSMLATLNVLTASKKKAHRSQSLKTLRQLPRYRVVGGEAIDLLGAHGQPIPDECRSLDYLIDWLTSWLRPLKQSLGVPIIPIARSASVAPILGVHYAHPDLLDGVVFLSPMVPFDAEHSNADLLGRVANSQCELNQIAFDYMNGLVAQTDWDVRDDPFQDLPTLIFTGGRDTQVSDRVRQRCREWGERFPNVHFHNLIDAGHDVFNLRDREAGLEAFEIMYHFMDEVCDRASGGF